MGMVFCRGCGKEIHETAPTCPHCGAPQNISHVSIVAQENAGSFFGFMFAPFRKYATFKGRARRKEYWYFALLSMLINVFFNMFEGSTNPVLLILLAIIAIAMVVPSIAVGVRRLHDTDRSGWWLLLPIVNLIFLCQDSDKGDNRFGASPKYPQ